jgi:hypothetical protein
VVIYKQKSGAGRRLFNIDNKKYACYTLGRYLLCGGVVGASDALQVNRHGGISIPSGLNEMTRLTDRRNPIRGFFNALPLNTIENYRGMNLKYYCQTIEEVVGAANSSMSGITNAEAEKRLAQNGRNKTAARYASDSLEACLN